MGQLVIGHSGKRWLMENGGPWYRSQWVSLYRKRMIHINPRLSKKKRWRHWHSIVVFIFFRAHLQCRLTVNGGQYGAGASINGGRPRGADDAICSAYYQGRADTAPSVPSAPSASFSKHSTINDSTTLATAVVTINSIHTAWRHLFMRCLDFTDCLPPHFSTLGRIK